MTNVSTTRWQASMFALMVVARPITNRELRELAGLEITADVRRCADSKILRSSPSEDEPIIKVSERGIHTYSLSARGLAWCESALLDGPPDDAKFPSGVLYAVLERVGQHLARSGTKFKEFFQPDLETWIYAAYADLTSRRPGSWVKLSSLRPRLGTTSRDMVDAALDRMIELPGFHLKSELNQSALTDADREASLRIGGEDRHLLKIEASV
ncbi:hypothetical protein M1L60_41480 [Actinoplanes sp. TRM 88003]|uniref:Transcriptional regulator n=1 Tax=Paractinoplanes aksuensis TaxID=2939490 RepID=A0ABT1E1S2_9ACTN|nr:hypothetical protein [Actinoplanes aksuensis]MCO8277069.1 hypothetical protein [Actinoplanes aksuensis]